MSVEPIRRFADEAGGVLPLVSIMASLLFAGAAFGVDYGSTVLARQRAQSAADLAALVAAQDPTYADRLARLSLADNGYTGWSDLRVETGRYVTDPTILPAQRFIKGAAPPTAVRVSLSATNPLIFGRLVSGTSAAPVAASAVATKADVASFSIGSRLARLQGGALNAVLGSMLGANLSLTAMDYEALASARLDAFKMLDGLATSMSLKGATFNDVLASRASVGSAATAAASAAAPSGTGLTASSALRQIADALRASTVPVSLPPLLPIGDLGQGRVGTMQPAPLYRNALDYLADLAVVSNGTRQVQVNLGAAIPGTSSAHLTISVGEPPQGSGATGAVGTGVETAQTRLLLDVTVPAPFGLGTLRLPIFLKVASGKGVLAALTCPWSSSDQLAARVRVTPGLVEAAIADISLDAVDVAGRNPDLTKPIPLLTTLLVSVSGRARATIGTSSPTELVFNGADIATSRVRTATSTGMVSGLATSLIDNLTLDVSGPGVGVSIGSVSLRNGIMAALLAVAPKLDDTIDGLLRGLGIGVGQADVWIDAARCDRAVLVQ